MNGLTPKIGSHVVAVLVVVVVVVTHPRPLWVGLVWPSLASTLYLMPVRSQPVTTIHSAVVRAMFYRKNVQTTMFLLTLASPPSLGLARVLLCRSAAIPATATVAVHVLMQNYTFLTK